MVVKIVDFGVYLGTKDEKVLLPKKEVPAGIEVGDPIEVFLYKDSSDRIIATTRIPKLMMGEVPGRYYSKFPLQIRSLWQNQNHL